ncbi:MAG: uroporphyrinogen-III synthase [Gammaproteobacteria bacterium]|nr:uroporphyrinogen-III synthase [Gammaproteobacteria bacterium]
MTDPRLPLTGRRILVCRPADAGERLCAELQAAGAQTRLLPLLDIAPLAETPSARQLAQNLDQFQHVIVISPTAARFAIDWLEDTWPQWPVGQIWYGVGQGTAQILRDAGLQAQAPRQGCTSEDLLALPALQTLDTQRVLLLKGEGGRPVLAATLQARGARVESVDLYRRTPSQPDPTRVREALCDFDPHLIIALTAETLNNLIALGENTDHNLRRRGVVVPAQPVAEHARQQGFRDIRMPTALSGQALIDGLRT